MRCALFLAAWAVALAAEEPALDPWLQALYGHRRLRKKDVRLLQAKIADDYGGSQAAGYDYGGADYAHVPASSLLGRIFQKDDLEYYDDEPTTLYCITVTPKPYTTQSTTPEVICFPPSRRPKTRTTPRTTTTTTTTAAPVGNCDNDQPQPPVVKPTTTTTTTEAPHHHYGHPSSTTNRHHQGHPEDVECITGEHEKARPTSTTHASSTRTTAKTHPSSAKTTKVSPSTQKTTTKTTTRATTRFSPTSTSTKHTTPSTHTHAAHTTRAIPVVNECGAVLLRTVTSSTSRKTSPQTVVTTHKHVTTTHKHVTTTHKHVTTTRKPVTVRKALTTQKTTTRKTVTTRKPTTAHVTTPLHVRKISPPSGPEACEVAPRPAPTTMRRTVATPPAPKTRPPVDEFLAAWGFFKHHNSLDPRNASHWREFHNVNGPRAPRRRDVAKRDDVVVILPPWLRQSAHPGLAFVVPPAQPVARRLAKREQKQPERPGLTFVVPPVEAQLAKRDEQPTAASTAPYKVYWFSSWPPAGREVSRPPGRDTANFVKLSSWWQDVIKTYNGHQRKRRGLKRR